MRRWGSTCVYVGLLIFERIQYTLRVLAVASHLLALGESSGVNIAVSGPYERARISYSFYEQHYFPFYAPRFLTTDRQRMRGLIE